MDGRDPGPVHLESLFHQPGGAQGLPDPLANLGRGLLGEGDGQHLVDGLHAAFVRVEQGVGDAPGEHEGLARARARGDNEGPRYMLHTGELLIGGEPCEQVHPRRPFSRGTSKPWGSCRRRACRSVGWG